MQKISKDIKNTKEIAKDFLVKILKLKNKNATIVGLYGDLGVGKTAFTQAVAKILGVKGKINSPTYVIMKRYVLPKKTGYKNFLANKTKPVSAGENFYTQSFFKHFFHLDAYRLKNEKELLHLGWAEMIADPKHLIFVEWPENVLKALPKKHHKIHIKHTKEGHRKFQI